jgi:hypothetical protein
MLGFCRPSGAHTIFINDLTRGYHPGLYSVRPLRGLGAGYFCAPASGDFSLSASSSAARSSAGLMRPLCLKTTTPERS